MQARPKQTKIKHFKKTKLALCSLRLTRGELSERVLVPEHYRRGPGGHPCCLHRHWGRHRGKPQLTSTPS